MDTQDFQVGADFKALDKGVLVAALKSTGYFFPFQFPWKCGEWSATAGPGGSHFGPKLTCSVKEKTCKVKWW